MDASAHDLHGAAHFGKSRTCVIADLILGWQAALDLIVDRRQRIQGAEALIKGIIWKFFGFLMASVALRAGSDCQQGADSEKLRDPLGNFRFPDVSWNHAHPSRRRRRDFPSCGRASGHRSSPSGSAGSSPDHRTAAVPGTSVFPSPWRRTP